MEGSNDINQKNHEVDSRKIEFSFTDRDYLDKLSYREFQFFQKSQTYNVRFLSDNGKLQNLNVIFAKGQDPFTFDLLDSTMIYDPQFVNTVFFIEDNRQNDQPSKVYRSNIELNSYTSFNSRIAFEKGLVKIYQTPIDLYNHKKLSEDTIYDVSTYKNLLG